jgi:hypothetical protein
MRTGAAAVAYAKSIRYWPVGYCLKFVRTCFGVGSKYPSAHSAWINAKHKHGPTSAPPPGVPVYWSGGRYGHVAMSLGNWKCRSTDWPRRGQVNDVDIRTLAREWGYRYDGWAEDINDQRIYTPPKPVVKPPLPYAPAWVRPLKKGSRGEQVKFLQAAFGQKMTGLFDQALHDRVVRHQRLRPTLWPADGIVGPKTYASIKKNSKSWQDNYR